uniref:Uncharacterized protein n=1 Tax=Noctiluca scintillans TaxID=2966 RepID=A0A7S0ZVX9_NOCSC|mmetsp:Transcript_21147/g.56361  ORF Transcript_21147/g.56361 Transcript_21147/m.56361 type:complete len:169 (+) Transcript_21147:35-541(+)
MWLPDTSMYPADGWTPSAYTGNEDLRRYEETLDALPKKTLVKRLGFARERLLETISQKDRMEEHGYSLLCVPLAPWSRGSGEGDQRGWLVWVYYEPRAEDKVETALGSFGFDLSQSEREPVDPDSPEEEEQLMMYLRQQSQHVSLWEHQVLEDGEELTRPPDVRHAGW